MFGAQVGSENRGYRYLRFSVSMGGLGINLWINLWINRFHLQDTVLQIVSVDIFEVDQIDLHEAVFLTCVGL